jgi:hypothetical protein
MEVNSLWIGKRLTKLETLCISSFIKNGIGYNLYAYDLPVVVPKDVVLKDAADILPRTKIFRYQAGTFNVGSVAGFSNLFRYTLIDKLGGWWVDTDHCCLQPFPCDADEIYFQQPPKDGELRVTSGFFKAPARSPVLRYCLDVFAKKDVTQIVHGETGPRLLTEAVLKCGKWDHVLGHERFYPVAWWDYQRLLFDETLSLERCFTAHFYNSLITSAGLDKDAVFPAQAPFEQLKRKYL